MKVDAILTRFDFSAQGSFGRFVAGKLVLFSGELPDHGNASDISCVLLGTYCCVFTPSPRFSRPLYLVCGVPGRSGIRIHPATLMGDKPPFLRQLNGCIALGEAVGWMAGQKAIFRSVSAVRKLEEYFRGRPFTLEIRNGNDTRDSR